MRGFERADQDVAAELRLANRIALMKQQRVEPIMAERKRDSKTPGTLKEVLSHNVRQQQRRSSYTASPPEAKRPVRERVKSAAKKSRS